MKTFTTLLLAGTAGVAVMSTAGLASASPTTPASPTSAGRHHSHHRLLAPAQRQTLRRTGHVEVIKHTRKHGDVTLEVQRGAITALTPSSITLLSKGGYSHGYLLTPATVVHEKGKNESVTDLTVNERVIVVAVHGPTGDAVRRITCVRAPVNTHVASTAAPSSAP